MRLQCTEKGQGVHRCAVRDGGGGGGVTGRGVQTLHASL